MHKRTCASSCFSHMTTSATNSNLEKLFLVANILCYAEATSVQCLLLLPWQQTFGPHRSHPVLYDWRWVTRRMHTQHTRDRTNTNAFFTLFFFPCFYNNVHEDAGSNPSITSFICVCEMRKHRTKCVKVAFRVCVSWRLWRGYGRLLYFRVKITKSYAA